MVDVQNGHSNNDSEQFVQVHKWLHGVNRTEAVSFSQTLHNSLSDVDCFSVDD